MTGTSSRSFFPNRLSVLLAGAALAGLGAIASGAQQTPAPPTPPTTTETTQNPGGSTTTVTTGTTTDQNGIPQQTVNSSVTFTRGKKKKDDKVVQAKATKKAVKKDEKVSQIAKADPKLPDKQLYDKAMDATKHGHYDVARLDLQTMLNTYPDSQYQMRAKLAIADSWYKEGGTGGC